MPPAEVGRVPRRVEHSLRQGAEEEEEEEEEGSWWSPPPEEGWQRRNG